MSFSNCPKCGKLFHFINNPLCDNCKKEEEEIFEKVREYVKDNPGSNINKISQETEVSQKKILKYVREGRIELSSEIGMGIQCEKCGRNIRTGKFCTNCISNLSKHITKSYDDKNKNDAQKSARMFTDRKDRD